MSFRKLGVLLVLTALVSASYADSCGEGPFPAYNAQGVKYTTTGVKALLVKEDSDKEETMGTQYSKLQFEADFDSNYQLHVKITVPSEKRWEIPLQFREETKQKNNVYDRLYDIAIIESPFSFTVTRRRGGEVLFDTNSCHHGGELAGKQFYFGDKYLQLTTTIDPTAGIAGLGERVHSFTLNQPDSIYTIWALDDPSPIDDGKAPGKNMYGTHPFYLDIRKSGNYNGVLFGNQNAMDVYFSAENTLTYRSVGGIFEFYFFLGPDPESVIQQYHALIGRPALLPYWSLGWNQCRWGYTNLTMLEEVVEGYTKNDIPLDTMWSDIDYMFKYYDFTLDPARYDYAQFKQFVDKLHNNGQQFVPIVDAGVAQQDYFGYNEGIARDVFIKRFKGSDEPLIGKVWPGLAAFPDWFHPNTTQYWGDMLGKMYETVKFDGIWLDMNEASNFCNGTCDGVYNDTQPTIELPYTPGQQSLDYKCLSVVGQHYGGDLYTEFNVHGLFGYMETQATNKFLKEKLQKRPMIISRSTFPGHGSFGGHWLGDNYSKWEYMRASIVGIFNTQMYGIPLVGADICGFIDDTNLELCLRWTQVGVLYPFSRNHANWGTRRQEPYYMGSLMMDVAREYIRLKYSIVNYYYSLTVDAHVKGGSVFRPLMFNYRYDTTAQKIEEQFMLGDALMAAPVLYPGKRSVDVYFPQDYFYDFYTGEFVSGSAGFHTIDAPLNYMPLFMRGGSIIPTQNSDTATNLSQMRKRPMQLLIALDQSIQATGSFYLDDGSSLDTIEKNEYIHVNCNVTPFYRNLTLSVDITTASDDYTLEDFPSFSEVRVFGMTRQVFSIAYQIGNEAPVMIDEADFIQDTSGLLDVFNLDLPKDKSWKLRFDAMEIAAME